MIRDDEINRLVKYAQGLNTTVKFKQYIKGSKDAGGWTIDGSEITIYTTDKTPKIYIVLCLLHELGHHLEHIHGNDRELDEKLDAALDPEDEQKKHRKKILDWEIRGSKWWETIYKETDCKFDMKKLYIERDFDLWQYEVYYETGKFPTKKLKDKKRKEICDKHRG